MWCLYDLWKRLWHCKYIWKKEGIVSAKMCSPHYGTRLAKPYSHPCKADIYFCIFCRWIQCRPRTPLATLRNRVKWMYVLVSEIHAMLQLSVLDLNRSGFDLRIKKSIPKGQDHWFKVKLWFWRKPKWL